MRTAILTISLAALLSAGSTAAVIARPRSASGQKKAANVAANYRMSSSNKVTMVLSGSMPLHDWTMTAHGLLGEGSMLLGEDHSLAAINGLSFTLPVKNLHGAVSKMDEDCYNSLKAERYPNIIFTLTSATLQTRGERTYAIAALGNLTVAGVTRPIRMTMNAQVMADGTIVFTGSQNLKMSDYHVEPPSLLFGAIKADDNIALTYTLIFVKQQPLTQQ